MSAFASDLREIGGGVTSRVRRLRSMAARATAVPLLVRLWVWLAAAVAMLLTFPGGTLFGGRGLVLFGIAALPALIPRTGAVAVVMVFAVGGWLITTTAYPEWMTVWRLVLLAAALYLLHSAVALAAQLPYDAIVSPGVLVRWVARTGLVVAGTALVAVYELVIADALRGRAFVAATLGGLAAALGLAAVLARLSRR
jgi:hypothetical protein